MFSKFKKKKTTKLKVNKHSEVLTSQVLNVEVSLVDLDMARESDC